MHKFQCATCDTEPIYLVNETDHGTCGLCWQDSPAVKLTAKETKDLDLPTSSEA